MLSFRKTITFLIYLMITPLAVVHAQTVAFHSPGAEENDVIVVPNRDLTTSIDHDGGAVRMEISSDDAYRTYQVTLGESSYVAYADLNGPEKHFVFDPTQRRFRTLTSSVIVELHDDATLEDVMVEHDVPSGRAYPAMDFAIMTLTQDRNPTALVEQLRLDPRVVDAQVTFADQFRRHADLRNPMDLAGSSSDQVPANKDSLLLKYFIFPKLDFSATDPTFTISVLNLGARATPISTLRSELVAVVPDESTAARDRVSFTSVMTNHTRIMPIDPKAEPFDISVTFTRESLNANTTYFVLFNVYSGAFPAIGQHVFARNQSGFTLDALKRIRFTCVARSQELLPSDTDPLLTHQWHLNNTGQSAFALRDGVPGEDMGMMETLRDGPTGSGVKVAVVDTGLELCHPDLWANVEQGASFNFNAAIVEEMEFDPWLVRQESTDPFNFDPTVGHGTSVAGLIASTADNSIGGRGVAPGAQLRGYNMLQAAEQLHALIASHGASDYQPDSTGVDIFNMSFGSIGDPPRKLAVFEEQVFLNGVRNLRSGNGAIYVKGAGNSFGDCNSLGSYNPD